MDVSRGPIGPEPQCQGRSTARLAGAQRVAAPGARLTCKGSGMLTDLVLRGAPIGEIAARSAEVESLGFDAVGVTETNGNPFLAAAQAAQATSRVRVATAIALAFPRTPMDVAYTAWDLQALSAGRSALGLGSQGAGACGAPLRSAVDPPHPECGVAGLRAPGDMGRLGVRRRARLPRRVLQPTLMPPNFRPPPSEHPRPPVLLAAVREMMTEVAGEVADGFLGHASARHRGAGGRSPCRPWSAGWSGPAAHAGTLT